MRSLVMLPFLALLCTSGEAFLQVRKYPFPPSPPMIATGAERASASCLMAAKNKGKKRSAGAGFGKVDNISSSSTSSSSSSSSSKSLSRAQDASTPVSPSRPSSSPQDDDSSPFLQSVAQGGSTKIPVIADAMDDTAKDNDDDDDMMMSSSAQDRAAAILREKYGMRTRQEQQADAQQVARVQEQRQRFQALQEKAERGRQQADDKDLMTLLPAPVLIAVDRFLKIGVGVSGLVFVLAGLGITWEAWSTISDNPLPENVDTFITNTIEPNFTTGLLVLLGFSVSLGIFSALQLSSAGAQYKEGDK